MTESYQSGAVVASGKRAVNWAPAALLGTGDVHKKVASPVPPRRAKDMTPAVTATVVIASELQQNSAMFCNKKVDMLNYLRADVYSENGNFLKLCNQEGVS